MGNRSDWDSASPSKSIGLTQQRESGWNVLDTAFSRSFPSQKSTDTG